MVKIWGLDLREMQWKKFKSSYMWNNVYHLRRTKFIVYQCAMIFCVVSESLGTAALSDYIDQQSDVNKKDIRAVIHNDDFVGAFSYNIFVGVYVATIFGSAFFFDLFWPERKESRAVKIAWRICSVFTILFTLSSTLLITIILATHSAQITGVSADEARDLLERSYPNEPLVYKHNKRGIASVVFIWPGLIATIASTLLLWHCIAHIDTYGPFSTRARTEPKEEKGLSQTETPVDGTNEHRDAAFAAAYALSGSSHRSDPPAYEVNPAGMPKQPPMAHASYSRR